MTIPISIKDLNENNGLGVLTSFLSFKENSVLRASSSKFRTAIPDFSEEAKAFLIFESHLRHIHDIIRRTESYEQKILMRQDFDAAIWQYASAPSLIAPLFAAPPLLILAGYPVEKAFLPAAFLIYPVTLVVCSFLVGKSLIEIEKASLRRLWMKFQNQHPPQDLITAKHQLRDQLEHHRRLSAVYAAAGGIDRYYATSGLDSALSEIRARR